MPPCPADHVQAAVRLIANRIETLREDGATDWRASAEGAALSLSNGDGARDTIDLSGLRCRSAQDDEQVVELLTEYLLPRLHEVVTARGGARAGLLRDLKRDVGRKVAALGRAADAQGRA